jgi:hypothetical protein
VRSGDEPVHARSALRLRLSLALLGVLASVAGAVLTARSGHPPLAAMFAVVTLIAVVNTFWVLARIRQGSHFQPGRDVPPYRPVADPPERAPGRPGRMPSARSRQRTYLIMMAGCLALVLIGWLGIRPCAPLAGAVVVTIGTLIPPVAAIVANAGWDEQREDRRGIGADDARCTGADARQDDGRASQAPGPAHPSARPSARPSTPPEQPPDRGR